MCKSNVPFILTWRDRFFLEINQNLELSKDIQAKKEIDVGINYFGSHVNKNLSLAGILNWIFPIPEKHSLQNIYILDTLLDSHWLPDAAAWILVFCRPVTDITDSWASNSILTPSKFFMELVAKSKPTNKISISLFKPSWFPSSVALTNPWNMSVSPS